MKTTCPHGHAYTEDNVYSYRGRRQCKTCRRDRSRTEQRQLRHLARLARTAITHDEN